MSCTQPLRAFYTGLLTDNGKPLLYVSKHHINDQEVKVSDAEKSLSVSIPLDPGFVHLDNYPTLYRFVDVPCGKCLACRQHRAKEWATRCVLEASKYQENYFITLTFNDDFLPKRTDPKDITMFMKRLRNRCGKDIRFFACGELGSRTNRPHYHLIVFNCHLDDLKILRASPLSWISKTISEIWPYGNHMINQVNEKTCAYVAQYTSKKVGDKRAGFIQMSRRPGIGADFAQENLRKIYESEGFYYRDGEDVQRSNVPRYFKKLMEREGYDVSKLSEHAQEAAKRTTEKDIYRLKAGNAELLRDFKRDESRLRSRKERGL